MRISRIETFKYFVQWRNWMFVKVTSDEGLYGWGEASLHGSLEAVETAIGELGNYLIGKDPAGIEAHWYGMYHAWRWRGGPVLHTAIAGLECALWDIEGKRLGVPVYRLLGGPLRPRIRAYASHWLYQMHQKSDDQLVEEVQLALGRGFTAFKCTPFNVRELREDEAGAIAKTRQRMALIREAAGPSTEIMIECAEHFTPRQAKLMAKALEPYRPYWFEEPIPFENPKAMAVLRPELGVPLATGERLLDRWQFRELLELQGADIIQPDLIHAGGITEVRKIASLADTYYVPVAPHNSSGPIATLMSVHLCAAIPNFLILEEIEYESELRNQVSTHPAPIVDGYFNLPVEPGIGTDLKLEVLEAGGEAYRYRPQPVSNRTVPPQY
ncbi:MAG: mandelate racemase/muconate lactonizing enzyme family protein [Chloroflexi bacterium]|nr:mandelate racemase/muconate lactonizing enzyme family protein [Chloroflexota bacterium]